MLNKCLNTCSDLLKTNLIRKISVSYVFIIYVPDVNDKTFLKRFHHHVSFCIFCCSTPGWVLPGARAVCHQAEPGADLAASPPHVPLHLLALRQGPCPGEQDEGVPVHRPQHRHPPGVPQEPLPHCQWVLSKNPISSMSSYSFKCTSVGNCSCMIVEALWYSWSEGGGFESHVVRMPLDKAFCPQLSLSTHV